MREETGPKERARGGHDKLEVTIRQGKKAVWPCYSQVSVSLNWEEVAVYLGMP